MAAAELRTSYAGRKGRLFRLALGTGALSVLSAGLYRFWMKTRLRRYLWSAVRPGGVPLEYVGNPWEKLMGFLFAVVLMAFYIGVVNLLLMFFSFSLFQTNAYAYALSFVGVLPLLFFARYRARRYILARSRWRGIRFGLEPGAWGYSWRASAHWLATILTLGLYWPRKTFCLEKYLTDRTWFGDRRLHQGGRWTMLIGAMKHLYAGVGLSALVLFVALGAQRPSWLLALFVTLPWTFWGLAYWRAHSFRRLFATREIAGAGFRSEARPGRVLGIYLGGYFLTLLVVSAGAGVFVFLFGVLVGLLGFDPLLLLAPGGEPSGAGQPGGGVLGSDLPLWIATIYGLVAYFASFLFWSAARHSFVTLPLARHFAETLHITEPVLLARVRQRGRDAFAEAEGFADALDVGAAL